jgi:phosphatidylglycerophosphatase A
LFGFYFCFQFTKNNLEKDPSYIVIDEVVGMMIGLFLLPKNIPIYIMAFILFRFFDIIKPSIIDRSQNFKFGIGIMADDIISGILTLLIIKGLYI